MADVLTELMGVLVGPDSRVIERINETSDQPTLVALHLAERKGRRRPKVLAAIEARGILLELPPVGKSGAHLQDAIVKAVASIQVSRPSAGPLGDLSPDELYPVPGEDDFEDPATGRAWEYMRAPDLEELAQEVLHDHADELADALDWKVRYLWKRRGPTGNTKDTLGTCQRLTGLAGFLDGDDFLVSISADHCKMHGFARRQMEALLYHELRHIGTSEKFAPMLVGHDVEMFIGEVESYGPWKGDLQIMASQLGMRL